MPHFTEEQLRELEKIFNLTRKETLPVRDGVICRGDLVWWRCIDGPVQEEVSVYNWKNIQEYPKLYQLNRPATQVTYLD